MSLCVKGRLVSINWPQVYQKRIWPHYFAKKRERASQPAEMHLRCIFEMSLAAASPRHLKES